jgi:hypothetical protein
LNKEIDNKDIEEDAIEKEFRKVGVGVFFEGEIANNFDNREKDNVKELSIKQHKRSLMICWVVFLFGPNKT